MNAREALAYLKGIVAEATYCDHRAFDAIAAIERELAKQIIPEKGTSMPKTFTLEWDAHNKMATLRRSDGFTIVAHMGERTYQHIAQAKTAGADFYELKAMFPQKRSVFTA